MGDGKLQFVVYGERKLIRLDTGNWLTWRKDVVTNPDRSKVRPIQVVNRNACEIVLGPLNVADDGTFLHPISFGPHTFRDIDAVEDGQSFCEEHTPGIRICLNFGYMKVKE